MDDTAKGGLTQFYELLTVIPCAPKDSNLNNIVICPGYLKTVGSQIKNEGSLKLKKAQSYDFWLKTLRHSKVRAAKDHGKKFRTKLNTSFSGNRDLKQVEAVKKT